MKKIVGMLVVMLLSIGLISGCGMMGGGQASYPGNLVQSDGWLYYTKDNGLYKMKSDWTGKTKLADNFEAQFIVVDSGVIFYADKDMNLYRMNTDGTAGAKILSEGKLMGIEVSDGWVYYNVKPSGLYKMRIDGTENTKLADISDFMGEMKISGDWVYYVAGTSIYRMKTDGTGQAKLADGKAGMMQVKDGWVYYDEMSGEKTHVLMRIKIDGTEKARLFENSSFISIDGEWLYFSKDNALYRSKLDGTGAAKLNDVNMWNLIGIWGDYIYYSVYEGPVYRINLDGSGKVQFE
jgi:hypothetical protein